MDDKTTSSPDMTEYKFTESEGVPAADQQVAVDSGSVPGEETPAPVASRFSIKNIDWHRFKMPTLIVVAITLMYGIFNFYSAKKTHMAEQKKAEAQDIAVMEQPVVSALPTKEIAVQQQQPAPFLSNDQIVEQVQTAVQQKLSEVNREMSSNRGQLSSLGEAISKAQHDISGISQNVGQLTVAMQQVLAEIQQLKTPKIKTAKKKLSKPLAIYHIRAIVPGRVWLESADGKSATLRVGDSLEGYGTVEVISPRQGMVLMSNGSYIQYGINDF